MLFVGLPCGSVVGSKHYRTACQSPAVALSVGPVMLHALSELEGESDRNSGKSHTAVKANPHWPTHQLCCGGDTSEKSPASYNRAALCS